LVRRGICIRRDYSINNKSINAGKYIAEIVSNCDDYFFTEATFEYTIHRYEIKLNWQDTILKYTGYPQKPTAKHTEIDFLCDVKIEVFGAQTEVGDKYLAYAVLQNNLANNFTLVEESCEYSIIPKEVSITWTKTEFIYDGATHSPTYILSENDADLKIKCTEAVDAGEYDISATTENKNYILKYDPMILKILSQAIEVEWGNTEFEYDGNFHCPTANYLQIPLKITGAQKNAGDFIAKCVSEDNNYNVTNDTKSYKISKYTIDVTWENDSFVYDGTSKLPTSHFDVPNFGSQNDFYILGSATNAGADYVAELKCKNTNFYLKNSTKTFEIVPYSIKITWEESNFVYNGEIQTPKYYFDKTDLTRSVEVALLGGQSTAGTHTVTLKSNDENFVLENAEKKYTIERYTINIEWIDGNFVYNGKPQSPNYRAQIPSFAKDLKLEDPLDKTNAGVYFAVVSINTKCADVSNFVLSQNSKQYEIEPYILELEWSDVDTIFSGKTHIPSAKYKEEIDFAPMPQLTVSGGQSLVGLIVLFRAKLV